MRNYSLTALTFTILFSTSALAKEPLKGRFEINGRAGNDRSIAMTEFWVPFSQNEESVIYGDLRLMGDNKNNREGNLGVGYRKITKAPYLGKGVAGIHSWIDKRITDQGSKFYQATIGTEWLSQDIDIRTNAYIPLSDKKEYTISNPNANNLTGNTIQVGTNGTLVEEPLYGLDLELGYELGSSYKYFRDHTDSFRIYGGGYYFDGDHTKSVQGIRGRVITDISKNIQLGARIQHDNSRDTQGFLEATFRFPIDAKQSYRDTGLYARLEESPERDIDIVTNDTVTETPDTTILINKATGLPQEVLIVDNTAAAGGDGSAEKPFNTLASAEAAASAHTILYMRRGNGNITNQDQGILLNKTGQQLIGSGTDFVYEPNKYKTKNGKQISSNIITPATEPAVITNINAGGDGIHVRADDITIGGIKIVAANDDGITVNNAQNFTLYDTEILNSGNDGLDIFIDDNRSHDVSINNLQTSSSGDKGIELTVYNSSSLNYTQRNSISSNNGDQGISLSYSDNSTGNALVDSSTLKNNNNNNIQVYTHDNTKVNWTIKNNIIDGTNLYFGILVRSSGDSSVDSAIIKNNHITNSKLDGIVLDLSGSNTSTINNAVITENKINNNRRDGISLGAYRGSGGILNALIESNDIQNNDGHGIQMGVDENASLSASVNKNLITLNDRHGINIYDSSTGSNTIDLGGGTFGAEGQNRIYDNADEEIRVDLDGAELKAENNYWGSNSGLTPSETSLIDASSIDFTPFLTETP